jgi:hypothetical protein
MLIILGLNLQGEQLRNRKVWKCAHCNECQFAEANAKNKATHLKKKHGILKDGNREPRKPMDRFLSKAQAIEQSENLRQSEAYVQLTTKVVMDPFIDALVAFVVICQLALSLVTNRLFVEFLEVIYPNIEQLLPKKGDTIRVWIKDAFKRRKARLKLSLHRANSRIHFSFDLWTSPNHFALLGIIAHYIDEYGQNQSVSYV